MIIDPITTPLARRMFGTLLDIIAWIVIGGVFYAALHYGPAQ